MITVPLDMVFCRKTALKFAGPELAALYSKVTSDETLVALMLMRERALGKRSRFAPFVDILPSAVPVPFVFTEAELSEFHDEGFVRKARNTRSRHDAEYRQLAQTGRLKTLLTTTDGDGARPTESAVTMFGSKQSYLWAQSLVGSRTLTLSGKRFLVPFADFFNYSPTGRKRAARGGEHFLKHHRLDENAETFTVLADRDCPAGEQLYEDYGDNPNDIYAQYHAFVAPDNPFDCISVTLPGLEEGRSSKLTKAHARLAKSMNVKDFSHGPVECLYSSAASSNKAMPRGSHLRFLRWYYSDPLHHPSPPPPISLRSLSPSLKSQHVSHSTWTFVPCPTKGRKNVMTSISEQRGQSSSAAIRPSTA